MRSEEFYHGGTRRSKPPLLRVLPPVLSRGDFSCVRVVRVVPTVRIRGRNS